MWDTTALNPKTFGSLSTPSVWICGIHLQEKGVPQRLKPSSMQAFYGTAEAVPFVRSLLLHSSKPLRNP
jgi:hypothetical protein